MNNKAENCKKGKRKHMGWTIALIIVAVLVVGGGIGWSRLQKEHNEAKNVAIENVNFKALKDGSYVGEYEGGMYKWRANKVEVTVESGKVTDIKLLDSSDPGKENTPQDKIYAKIIKEQSLQVDVISGATLTSKGYLKGVEIALEKAE